MWGGLKIKEQSMTEQSQTVNQSLAPLTNVTLFTQLLEKIVNRPPHLPGMGVFYGYSGYGKTCAAIYGANKYGAHYVEAGDSWSRTTLVNTIHHELTGAEYKGTIAEKVAEVVRLMAGGDGGDPKPLIIDEADFLVKRSMVDMVREIHDKSLAPVILIGEELLPSKLEEFERAHNRVLDWQAAQPVDMEDVQLLVRLYCPDVEIATDLVEHLADVSQGRARRVAVNLELIREACQRDNLTSIDMELWGDRQLYTGTPPARRRVA